MNFNSFFQTNRNSAPSSTAKGVYELKPEYQSCYSPYFYHYSRSEKTKVKNDLTNIFLVVIITHPKNCQTSTKNLKNIPGCFPGFITP